MGTFTISNSCEYRVTDLLPPVVPVVAATSICAVPFVWILMRKCPVTTNKGLRLIVARQIKNDQKGKQKHQQCSEGEPRRHIAWAAGASRHSHLLQPRCHMARAAGATRRGDPNAEELRAEHLGIAYRKDCHGQPYNKMLLAQITIAVTMRADKNNNGTHMDAYLRRAMLRGTSRLPYSPRRPPVLLQFLAMAWN
ncbi:hypothetical protein ACLOJK_025982 [Asimina triloba]